MEIQRRMFHNLFLHSITDGRIDSIYDLGDALQEHGIDINTLERYEGGRSVLMLAAEHPDSDMVKVLCELGADVNAVDDEHCTALLYASAAGSTACVIELCKQPGIDPNITRTEEEHLGESPLMDACWKCKPAAVKALLDCGADPNAARQADDEFTPLMYAINNRHGPRAARSIVELLLAAGADPEAVDSDDQTVFNQHRWEEVRTAGPGNNLPTKALYQARKQALAAGKARSNAEQAEINLRPPYGKNFVALQTKYNGHPGFRTERFEPTNLSLVGNIIGGHIRTRRRPKRRGVRKTRRLKLSGGLRNGKAKVNNYYSNRKDFNYYKKVKDILDSVTFSSIIDVGCRKSPIMTDLGKDIYKVMLDIEEIPPVDGIHMIKADFYTWEPDRNYDVVLCLQVLEHLDDPKKFAQKLLQVGKTVIISVPYKWKKGFCKHHLQDPVDESKLKRWMGREPDEHYISTDKATERMICVYR